MSSKRQYLLLFNQHDACTAAVAGKDGRRHTRLSLTPWGTVSALCPWEIIVGVQFLWLFNGSVTLIAHAHPGHLGRGYLRFLKHFSSLEAEPVNSLHCAQPRESLCSTVGIRLKLGGGPKALL